jgi:pimeloyl-ACP methyl ester carboxylesterase
VLGVVRAPVLAAGNSIGGYIVAALAADAPRSVAGVALLNPAGRVDGLAAGGVTGGGAPVQPKAGEEEGTIPDPPNRLFVEAASRALFAYLELSIGATLKRLYPTAPHQADEWLASAWVTCG